LDILRLNVGERSQSDLADYEAAFVILNGKCALSIAGRETIEWRNLGNRNDIFSGAATAIYAPRQSQVCVIAESKLEIAVAKAPCDVDLPPALIKPNDIQVASSGAANWRRDVRLIIPPGSQISQRLIVGETLNPPGNWSGIPPHKHDESGSGENVLEEFYFFKTKPANGFAVQLVYSNGQTQGHVVGNDDVIVFLNGYHPTVAAPGATVCYLWALAGEHKSYDITTDPRFSWVNSAEAILKEMQHH
jgi:5-deoxy-glucuronate isomerase